MARKLWEAAGNDDANLILQATMKTSAHTAVLPDFNVARCGQARLECLENDEIFCFLLFFLLEIRN